MNRRTASMLIAQSNPQIWTWKLNLVKSKYPPVRSLTLNIRQDGQNMIDTVELIDIQGNTSTGVVMHVYDGLPHPATVSPDLEQPFLRELMLTRSFSIDLRPGSSFRLAPS